MKLHALMGLLSALVFAAGIGGMSLAGQSADTAKSPTSRPRKLPREMST